MLQNYPLLTGEKLRQRGHTAVSLMSHQGRPGCPAPDAPVSLCYLPALCSIMCDAHVGHTLGFSLHLRRCPQAHMVSAKQLPQLFPALSMSPCWAARSASQAPEGRASSHFIVLPRLPGPVNNSVNARTWRATYLSRVCITSFLKPFGNILDPTLLRMRCRQKDS